MTVETRMSLRDLIGGIGEDARDLVRGEVALARAEIDRKMERLIAGIVSVFGAMMLAYVGLIIVLMAAAQALARVIPDWAASLVIGVIVLAIGCVMVVTARRTLALSGLIAQRVVRNVKAAARTVQESTT